MQTVAERIKQPEKEKPKGQLSDKDQTLLSELDKMIDESSSLKDTYTDRWNDNMKIMFGIPIEDKGKKSEVRDRNKMYYRKVWTIVWRFMASVYSALMADQDTARVSGRDNLDDWQKAGVVNEMMKYHVDRMRRKHNLLLKHLWAIRDILDNGFCLGFLYWDYREESGVDEPAYKVYPPEYVHPDFTAETEDEMRYCFFREWLPMSELEERGYKNLKKIKGESFPVEPLRQTRYNVHKDPTQVHKDDAYVPAGEAFGDHADSKIKDEEFYPIFRGFYKNHKDNKVYYIVFQRGMAILEGPLENPYGDRLPIVFGQCLTVPHRLIGEGFAEPLEGPQESFNYFMNMRKDNIALSLSPPTLVSRYAGVDLLNIVNTRPGGVAMGDDISENAVRWPKIPDVTANAFQEAGADDMMMNEMSGITAGKLGMDQSEKATTSQLNYMESNEKLNLFIAIISETYWKQFHSQLAYLITAFETDKKVIRIANKNWKMKEGASGVLKDVDDFSDFDADIVIDVGPTVAGRQSDIQNTMLAIDRGIMYNQQLAGMLQAGVVNPTTVKAINIQSLYEDLLPRLGKKADARYWMKLKPPPPPPPPPGVPSPGGEVPGGPGVDGLMGRISPQMGGREVAPTNPEAPTNDLKIPGLPNVEAP
jgi:hypothetical protein